MKFSIRFADQIVGSLVIFALAALVIIIFMLGSNQRWFVNDYQYKTYFTSASGIGKNMPVELKGFTIGHIKNFELSADGRVEIIFSIFEEHSHRVTEGSMVGVQESPIGLGSKFIFHPGLGTERIQAGELIPEISSPEAKYYIERGLAAVPQTHDSINNIINHVNGLLETINISLTGSQGAEDLILGQLLMDLNRIIANLNPVIEQVSDPSGSVMSILDGQGIVYQNLETSISGIAGIIENINKTSEVFPVQGVVLLNEVNSALRSVQDVLTAIANNPLLRGGIPKRPETGPGGASPRDLEF